MYGIPERFAEIFNITTHLYTFLMCNVLNNIVSNKQFICNNVMS